MNHHTNTTPALAGEAVETTAQRKPRRGPDLKENGGTIPEGLSLVENTEQVPPFLSPKPGKGFFLLAHPVRAFIPESQGVEIVTPDETVVEVDGEASFPFEARFRLFGNLDYVLLGRVAVRERVNGRVDADGDGVESEDLPVVLPVELDGGSPDGRVQAAPLPVLDDTSESNREGSVRQEELMEERPQRVAEGDQAAALVGHLDHAGSTPLAADTAVADDEVPADGHHEHGDLHDDLHERLVPLDGSVEPVDERIDLAQGAGLFHDSSSVESGSGSASHGPGAATVREWAERFLTWRTLHRGPEAAYCTALCFCGFHVTVPSTVELVRATRLHTRLATDHVAACATLSPRGETLPRALADALAIQLSGEAGA